MPFSLVDWIAKGLPCDVSLPSRALMETSFRTAVVENEDEKDGKREVHVIGRDDFVKAAAELSRSFEENGIDHYPAWTSARVSIWYVKADRSYPRLSVSDQHRQQPQLQNRANTNLIHRCRHFLRDR